METIRKMLKMPGWTQHLLNELTTLKRHVSAEVKSLSKVVDKV